MASLPRLGPKVIRIGLKTKRRKTAHFDDFPQISSAVAEMNKEVIATKTALIEIINSGTLPKTK
jgi:hypothetical protein